MPSKKFRILLVTPLAAGLFAGCLSQPEEKLHPENLAVAAATTSPKQSYVKTTWSLRTPTNLIASKIAFGANYQMWMVANGTGKDGIARTNGLFYLKPGTTKDWYSLGAAKSSAVKTSFASEPTTVAGASLFYINGTDGKMYQVNTTETAVQYGTGFSAVSVSNNMTGNVPTDLWTIKASDNYIHYRDKTTKTFKSYGYKAKALARGVNGILWFIDENDRACSQAGTNQPINCSSVKGSKIATGVSATAKAWMLGTEKISLDGEYAVYYNDGNSWMRSDASAKEITVDDKGMPWILKGSGQVYSGGILIVGDPTGTIPFGSIYGEASDIAVGGLNNFTWMAGIYPKPNNSRGYSYLENGLWKPTDGSGFSIDVDGGGQTYLVGSNNIVYRTWTGGAYASIGTQTMTDIGAGRGRIWGVGTDDFQAGSKNKTLYRLDGENWIKITKMGGLRIDIGPDDHAWVLDANGDVYESTDGTGANWKWHFGPRGTDIGVGLDGTVWIVSTVYYDNSLDFTLYRWEKSNDTWTLMPEGGRRISVDKNGKPWVTKYNNLILFGV